MALLTANYKQAKILRLALQRMRKILKSGENGNT
jgi:hypothetical protein